MVLMVETSNCPLLQLEKYGGRCTTESLTLVSAWTWNPALLLVVQPKEKMPGKSFQGKLFSYSFCILI